MINGSCKKRTIQISMLTFTLPGFSACALGLSSGVGKIGLNSKVDCLYILEENSCCLRMMRHSWQVNATQCACKKFGCAKPFQHLYAFLP